MKTYHVEDMRVYFPKGKTAENNPDRALTVTGVFTDDETGQELSYTSKAISKEDVKAEGFELDIEKGILTIPSGSRGRKAYPSVSQDEINDMLDSLKAED